MLKHKNIESYLPVFNGFYNTIFEADEEREIESPFKFDDYTFDYSDYQQRVSKKCCNAIENKLKDIKVDFAGISIKYQTLSSPKEYNFTNDAIHVAYKLDTKAVNAVNEYLNATKEAFEKYVLDRYTSRSGFSSFWSNDANVWLKQYIKDKKSLRHCFGAILEFIFENEGYTSYELYEDVCDECYICGSLKPEATDHVQYAIQYAKDNYLTKDRTTIALELDKHFEDLEIYEDYLSFNRLERYVNEVFADIEKYVPKLF